MRIIPASNDYNSLPTLYGFPIIVRGQLRKLNFPIMVDKYKNLENSGYMDWAVRRMRKFSGRIGYSCALKITGTDVSLLDGHPMPIGMFTIADSKIGENILLIEDKDYGLKESEVGIPLSLWKEFLLRNMK